MEEYQIEIYLKPDPLERALVLSEDVRQSCFRLVCQSIQFGTWDTDIDNRILRFVIEADNESDARGQFDEIYEDVEYHAYYNGFIVDKCYFY